MLGCTCRLWVRLKSERETIGKRIRAISISRSASHSFRILWRPAVHRFNVEPRTIPPPFSFSFSSSASFLLLLLLHDPPCFSAPVSAESISDLQIKAGNATLFPTIFSVYQAPTSLTSRFSGCSENTNYPKASCAELALSGFSGKHELARPGLESSPLHANGWKSKAEFIVTKI